MKYEIKKTSKFEKDYKAAFKRGLDLKQLNEVIDKLANGIQLEPKYNDHWLNGEYKGYRECHINPDWLLIYKKDNNVMVLTCTRTGTHSDLFRNNN